jgi:Holliday junction resolvasome RuvABC endonuclease subunit
MNRPRSKHLRVLAIAPSSRGFGFVVLERREKLVDWGVKAVKQDKNTQCLAKIEKLIAQCRPDVLVLEDHSSNHCRRSARIKALGKQIVALAAGHKIKVALFSREKVKRFFFGEDSGTKHKIAEILAKQFPEELSLRLPPKRRPWMNEDYRMDIFDALALALMIH